MEGQNLSNRLIRVLSYKYESGHNKCLGQRLVAVHNKFGCRHQLQDLVSKFENNCNATGKKPNKELNTLRCFSNTACRQTS